MIWSFNNGWTVFFRETGSTSGTEYIFIGNSVNAKFSISVIVKNQTELANIIGAISSISRLASNKNILRKISYSLGFTNYSNLFRLEQEYKDTIANHMKHDAWMTNFVAAYHDQTAGANFVAQFHNNTTT